MSIRTDLTDKERRFFGSNRIRYRARNLRAMNHYKVNSAAMNGFERNFLVGAWSCRSLIKGNSTRQASVAHIEFRLRTARR